MTHGTLAGALQAQGIDASQGKLSSEAVGDVVVEDTVLVIKRIRVHYRLVGCPEDKREAAERAQALHAPRNPAARSIGGSIEISTELSIA